MKTGLQSYLQRLSASLEFITRYFENPTAANRAVCILLAIHTGLLAYSANVHSPTLNEPAHLVAGLSHWKFGRFELYRENPPLVRMVAALPVMAAGYKENWSGFYEGPRARPVFQMGGDFVAANGERTFFLLMIARWACIPLSWVGAVTCYLWARDLNSRPAGVLACAIWCFEPNILAHASLLTPDVGATALGVAACYTFWKWLKNPTWSQAALTSIVLGLAELCKTTLILFYPLWPLLWLIYRWFDRTGMRTRDWLREAGMLALGMALGLYILNLGYIFEGTGTQLKDLQFVSDLFTVQESRDGREEPARTQSDPSQTQTEAIEGSSTITHSANRFANSWLGCVPLPFPKHYVLGVDIQQYDFEHLGQPSYLRGNWQDHGWWYYYLYAAAVKVPLGLWAMGLLSLCLCIFRKKQCSNQGLTIGNSRSALDTAVLLTPALAIFCIASAKTGFNEHLRYVLPCFPFLFIWLGATGVGSLQSDSRGLLDANRGTKKFDGVVPHYRLSNIQALSLPILCLWSFGSSLWIYPHSLSYFNESVGGPLNGPYHLLGSNVDWGQDLRYAAQRVKTLAPEGCSMIVYMSLFSPRDVGIEASPSIPPQNLDALSVNECKRRVLIVSNNVLFKYQHEKSGSQESLDFYKVWRLSNPDCYSMSTFVSR